MDAATKVSVTHLPLAKFNEGSAHDKKPDVFLMKYLSTLFSLGNFKQKDSVFCKLSKQAEKDGRVDVSCFSFYRKETQPCI